MNWKDRFVKVIEWTLNKDFDTFVYKVVFTGDDSFEILKCGKRVLRTECAEFYLASHWRMNARSAVLKLREDEFQHNLLLLEK